MIQCSTQEPNLAVPHDLVPGFRIVLAVPVAADLGNQAHGVAEPLWWLHVVLPRVVAQEVDFVVREHQVRVAVGDLPAENGHDHDAPGDHRIDRDRPLQPVGGAEQQELRPTAGFQDVEVIFDPPALEIEPHDLRRIPRRPDPERAQ